MKRRKRRCKMQNKKTFSIVASALAGIVLCGAFVYYNFIDNAVSSGLQVGDNCPDFTVNTYKVEDGEFKTGGEPFTLSDHLGKVVVINFWATYCGPCIAELPEFNQIQEDYADDVVVITLDGELSFTEERLAMWLNLNNAPVSANWKDFSITFGRYEEEGNNVYNLLGFSSGALPATVIVNHVGEVAFIKEGSMHYADLEQEILPLIK